MVSGLKGSKRVSGTTFFRFSVVSFGCLVSQLIRCPSFVPSRSVGKGIRSVPRTPMRMLWYGRAQARVHSA